MSKLKIRKTKIIYFKNEEEKSKLKNRRTKIVTLEKIKKMKITFYPITYEIKCS